MTFEELAKLKSGTILKDWYDDGIRYLIMRGPCALCAYFGIPIDHPLAGSSYDDLPVGCHGGLTFGSEGDGEMRPAGFYWYGWDYAHSGDKSFYNLDDGYEGLLGDKAWTLKAVEEDVNWNSYEIKRLVKLAERIANKEPNP